MSYRSKISFFAICLLAVGLTTTSARADVTYSFSALNDGVGNSSEAVGFQYTAPSFITSITTLMQSQLSSCTNCQGSAAGDVIFAPNVASLGDLLQFNDSNNVSSFYEFAAGAFGAVGTYSSGGIFNSTGTLTVSSSVAVPEPSSMALSFAGSIALAAFAFFRRKPVNAAQLA